MYDFVQNRRRHSVIYIFYCSIPVLYSIIFSITLLPTSTLEDEVEKEEEEEEMEGQSASEEEEIEIRFEDETVEQLEEEEEVVLTSEEESEMASEDENEFLEYFSDTNCETIVFPPGTLSGGRISTVPWWNSCFRSPPLLENEAVVSDVIELSLDSPGQHFDKAVTLVIPHCASDLKGYEVVVKSLSIGDEWKDVETADWRTKDGKKTMFFVEICFSMLNDLTQVASNFPIGTRHLSAVIT